MKRVLAGLGRLSRSSIQGFPSHLGLIAAIAALLVAGLFVCADTVQAQGELVLVEVEPSPVASGARALGQGQGEAATPNPLLYLDIWLFGGLILLVMIVVVLKYLWKFFQPDRRDPEEGLQPWEDPDYVYEDPEE